MFSMKGTTHAKAEAGKHGPSSLHGNQSSGYTEGGHVSHEDSKGRLATGRKVPQRPGGELLP